jgi:HEAT repeat protein
MRIRHWLLPALLATPLIVPVDGALACLRFKKPGGSVPPHLREPSDPPPPPTPTAPPPPPTTTPSDPGHTPAPTTTPTPGGSPPPTTTGPIGPTTGPDNNKKKANDDSTWETWWVLNRIEFFPHRYVHAVVTSEGPTVKGTKPLPADVVRQKLWKPLMTLKDDKQTFVREASLITIGRVASDESLKSEARTVLLAALKDPNHLVARAAALGLFYVADDEAIQPMLEVAKDPKVETDVRAFVTLTLTAMKSPLVGPLLMELVTPDRKVDFEFASSALMALGFVPGPEIARTLKDVYESKRFRDELRAEAVESFGRRGSFDDGVDVLTRAIDDRETQIRRSAAIALGVLDYRTDADRQIATLVEPYDLTTGAALPADVQQKVDALKALIPAQREAHDKKVREIVKKLGNALQNDTDTFVAGMAAISLGRIAAQTENPLATKVLLLDLKKERNVVREYEILALAMAKATDAYDICIEAIDGKGRQPTTRGAGMIGLGILGNPKGSEFLRKTLEDELNPMLRGFAAVALGILGDEKSEKPILTMLKSTKSPDAMADGALGLALLGRRGGGDVLLKQLTATSDGNVAAYTVYSLGLMKDRSKLDALVDVALNHENFFVQSAAVAAIGYVSSAEDYPRRHLMARGFNYMLGLNLLESYFYKL